MDAISNSFFFLSEERNLRSDCLAYMKKKQLAVNPVFFFFFFHPAKVGLIFLCNCSFVEITILSVVLSA